MLWLGLSPKRCLYSSQIVKAPARGDAGDMAVGLAEQGLARGVEAQVAQVLQRRLIAIVLQSRIQAAHAHARDQRHVVGTDRLAGVQSPRST